MKKTLIEKLKKERTEFKFRVGAKVVYKANGEHLPGIITGHERNADMKPYEFKAAGKTFYAWEEELIHG